MRKNKLVLVLSCVFSIIFLVYIFKITSDIGKIEENLIASPNVEDITDHIHTKLLVTSSDIGDNWTQAKYDDSKWAEVSIPKHRIVKEKDFKEGNFAYYRILIPRKSFENLTSFKNELSVSLQFILFSKLDIYINGVLFRTNSPTNAHEYLVNLPIIETQDNLISIKGYIKTGDSGINHRGGILIGKTGELNSLYSRSYKTTSVFSLVFLLCKGSILFVFTLIFLVVNVRNFFEKSLMFGMFVILEDILTADYLSQYLNLNQMVYLFNFANIGIILFLFLFLSDVLEKKYSKKTLLIITLVTSFLSFGIALDVLHTNYIFSIDYFLKFWNTVMIFTLAYFIPQIYKKDKVLCFIAFTSFCLTTWSAYFSSNVAFNFKAFSNLLIFFMVAYETFILFRREQNQLLEQEKDVTIGKTAALLAHDVRRPLDQMSLILNRISAGEVSEEFLRIAKHDVEFSINSVNNQINDIMNFSRINEVPLTPVSLYSVLSSSLKQVMSVKKNIDIKLEYNFKANKKILGDESRLASVFTNLISNAVEAIQDIGKKDVGLIRFSTNVQGSNLIFQIYNDGPAIPSSIIEDIFKPLVTYGKTMGTGLGLASVAKIVHEHQGNIVCENAKTIGVVFTLKLLISDIEDSFISNAFKSNSKEYRYETEPRIELSEKSKPIRIFLLDDDKYVFEYVTDLIKKISFDVELSYFSNYERALAASKIKRFDIYILDYDLGSDKNGQDFYLESLNFLKNGVVLHTNRDNRSINLLKLPVFPKPISVSLLEGLCNEAYSTRQRILLVEDSKLISIAWLMFHGKHNIQTVNSPEECLEFLELHAEEIDLCVLDFYFDTSSINGSELGNIIKKKYSSLEILISSSSQMNIEGFKVIRKNDYEVRGYRALLNL